MTTVALPEAIAAIEASMKAHDPTLLNDLEMQTFDGRAIPLRELSWEQLSAELTCHEAELDMQRLGLDAVDRFMSEMSAWFGETVDDAFRLIQGLTAACFGDTPTPGAVLSDGKAIVEPTYMAAYWDELSDLDRRGLRGRIDMQRRRIPHWRDLALAVARQFTRHDTPDLDMSDFTDDDWRGLGLTLWDALDTGNRDRLAAMWRQAVAEAEGGDR